MLRFALRILIRKVLNFYIVRLNNINTNAQYNWNTVQLMPPCPQSIGRCYSTTETRQKNCLTFLTISNRSRIICIESSDNFIGFIRREKNLHTFFQCRNLWTFNFQWHITFSQYSSNSCQRSSCFFVIFNILSLEIVDQNTLGKNLHQIKEQKRNIKPFFFHCSLYF